MSQQSPSNQEPPNKTLIAAIIGTTAIIIAAIIGLVSPFVENWAARYSPAITPTVGSIASPQVIVVTATMLPPSVNQPTPTLFPQSIPSASRCEWLAQKIPQSKEDVASRFGLPASRINLLYEACGNTATAFVVTLGTEVEMQVYEDGGCIDAPSDAKFTGNHILNPYASGERAYSGTVTAVVLTYRMWCDELH